MNIPLGAFLAAAAGPIAKRVLISIGFGIVTYSGVLLTLNSLIASARTEVLSMSGYVSAVFGMSGTGYALGLISAAMVYRVTYEMMPKLALLTK